MNRCGALAVIKKALLFLIIAAPLFYCNSVSAEGGMSYGYGRYPNGGACGTGGTWWDTCYGLSWQYYEWPKDSNGQPYNGNIYYWCTAATGCQSDVYPHVRDKDGNDVGGGKIKVKKECSQYGGFWYLGYEVYNSSNGTSLGYQVGPPKVDMIDGWILQSGMVPNVTYNKTATPLYPFGRSNLNPKQGETADTYKNPIFADILSGVTHEDITAEGYVPKECDMDSWKCPTKNPGGSTVESATKISGFKGKYYGSMAEVYLRYSKAIQKITSGGNNNVAFKDINWWCGLQNEDDEKSVDGQSSVKISGKDSDFIWSGWVYDDYGGNSESAKAVSEAEVGPNDVVTVEFHHQLKGGLLTNYTISMEGINNVSDLSGVYRKQAVGVNYTSERSVQIDMAAIVGDSITVCDTQTFGPIGKKKSSKACATLRKQLSLPEVESQTSATYKSSTRTSNWATKNAPVQSAETITATIPIMPSVDANGGVEVPITFTHDVKALHTELSVENTGDVPYTLTTTNTTNNYDDPGTFKITVGSASPTQFINPKITSDKTVKVKINDDFTACQTLSFDYDGITRKTTACVRFRGISADPKGISSIKINGCGGGQQVNTNYVDGAVVWLDIDSCTKDEIRGSDIVFDHGFSIGGEMSVVIPFEIENSCINGAGCSQNYSWPYDEENNKPNFKYTGRSDGSRTIVWVYRKKDSNGNLTNIYERNPTISDDDAKAMFEMGAVCETMAYKYDEIWHHSTACVRFNVKNSPCPSLGVSTGTTMSTSYVKKYLGNDTTSPTPDQTTVIYAKPTDNIEFTHCYYPGAQTTRYTDDDEGKYANPSNNGQTVLIPTPNAYVERQNRFTIDNKAGTDSYVDNRNVYTFTNYGQIMKYEEDSNAFVGVVGNPNSSAVVSSKTPITTNAVGHIIEQSLLDHPGTNSVSGRTQGICGSGCAVNYKNSFDNKWYDVIKRNSDSPISESSSAKVIVPYNYITRASIDTGNGIVYAGETMPGKKVNITVNKRQNNTVGDEYATKTVESTVRLFMFYTTNGNQNEGSDREVGGSNVNPCGYYGGLGYTSCVELQPESGKSSSGFIFNKNSSINGSNETVDVFENSYNVPDLRAGSKVCMGVSVYPAASTDTEPSNGNTFISRAYCRIVAKKPSFQVWGGSLYSAGNISANGATKYTIDGVYAYNPIHQSHAPSITYGSWVEQSIMSNGTVVGVYSGAATGYGATNLQVTNANPGGSSTSDLCNLSRLTFANVNCAINSVGNFGAAGTSTATKTSIKQEYATKASNKDADRNSDINNYRGINVSTAYTEEGNTRYTYASGSLALSASQRLATGVTHVIYAKGNIVIRKNSLLYNDGGYHTIDEIPQYIIIADGNIYIEPDVTRVDAILISGKTLNTCAKLTGGSITEAKKGSSNLVSNLYCAQQLKVNGVVIADTLKLYRIYGASTGLNSIAPAEIIDYTPNIYFWGSNSSTSHGSIYTSYQRELAPRQ